MPINMALEYPKLQHEVTKLEWQKEILLESLKEVSTEYEYALKLLAEAAGCSYSENNVVERAKKVIKNCTL